MLIFEGSLYALIDSVISVVPTKGFPAKGFNIEFTVSVSLPKCFIVCFH